MEGSYGFAIISLIIAVVLYFLGAWGIAGLSLELARILVIIFIILFVVALIASFL